MKKIYIHIIMLTAMVVAGAAMTSCQKEEVATGKFTMTVNATKGGGNVKQLTLNGSTLTASWATTENVYVQKGETWAKGSLQPQEAGTSTTLLGELSGITIAAEDVLTLQFPRSGARDYTGQVGTLGDIAAKYDYATASVTVASVSSSGNVTTAGSVDFENQQAIVKFTLKDIVNNAALNATQLVVNDGSNSYTITPVSGTDVMYVAIPGFSEQTVSLTANVGDDTYTYEKSGVTFANSRYYEITVKMTKQDPAPAPYTSASNATAEDVNKLICTDGHIHAYGADAECMATRVAMLVYVNGNAHYALALTDGENHVTWAAAIGECSGMNSTTPVAITGARWILASKDEWSNIITAVGTGNLPGIFSSVGGENMIDDHYWTSTQYNANYVYAINPRNNHTNWIDLVLGSSNVRACLYW